MPGSEKELRSKRRHGQSVSAKNQKSDRLNQYFCSSRTRKDLWNTIKSKTSNLKSTEDNIITKKEENHDELGRLIRELGEIEYYWAFPGTAAINWIKELYKKNNWKDLLEYVTLLARFISTDHYRSRD